MKTTYLKKGLSIILVFAFALSTGPSYVWAIARTDGGEYGPGAEGDPNTYQEGTATLPNGSQINFMMRTLSVPVMPVEDHESENFYQAIVDQKNYDMKIEGLSIINIDVYPDIIQPRYAYEGNTGAGSMGLYVERFEPPPPVNTPPKKVTSPDGLVVIEERGYRAPLAAEGVNWMSDPNRSDIPERPEEDPPLVPDKPDYREDFLEQKPGKAISEFIRSFTPPVIEIPEQKPPEVKPSQELLEFVHSIPAIVEPYAPPVIGQPPVDMPGNPPGNTGPNGKPTIVKWPSSGGLACWAYAPPIEQIQDAAYTLAAVVTKVVTFEEENGDGTTTVFTDYYLTILELLNGQPPLSRIIIIRTSRKRLTENGEIVEVGVSTGRFSLDEGEMYLINIFEDENGELSGSTYPGDVKAIDSLNSPEVVLARDIIALLNIEGTYEQINAFIGALEDTRVPMKQRETMRESAAVLLGQIGKPAMEAVPSLIDHLDDVFYYDYEYSDGITTYPSYHVSRAVLSALISITGENLAAAGNPLRTIEDWQALQDLYWAWWNNR